MSTYIDTAPAVNEVLAAALARPSITGREIATAEAERRLLEACLDDGKKGLDAIRSAARAGRSKPRGPGVRQ